MSLKGDIFFWTSPRPCVLGRVKGQGELGSEPGSQPLSRVFLAPRGALRARAGDGGPRGREPQDHRSPPAPHSAPHHALRSDAIYSARYDGSGHMEVLRVHEFLSHPFAVTLYGGEVYWTDWRTNTLAKANKWTGHNVTVVQRTNTQPFDLQVYHPSRQPMGKGRAGRAERGGLCRGGSDPGPGSRRGPAEQGREDHWMVLISPPHQLPTPVRPTGAGAPAPTCVSSITTGPFPAPARTS